MKNESFFTQKKCSKVLKFKNRYPPDFLKFYYFLAKLALKGSGGKKTRASNSTPGTDFAELSAKPVELGGRGFGFRRTSFIALFADFSLEFVIIPGIVFIDQWSAMLSILHNILKSGWLGISAKY